MLEVWLGANNVRSVVGASNARSVVGGKQC